MATKEDIAMAVYESGEDLATKSAARRVVDAIFAEIASQLTSEDEVSIAGFGKFKAKVRAARKGRNPQTGDVMKIAAKRVVTFKAGAALKDAVDT